MVNKIQILILILSATTIRTLNENKKRGEADLGGLKEWSTDMPVSADFILDEEAQKLADEAKKADTCIPIGEGENCW